MIVNEASAGGESDEKLEREAIVEQLVAMIPPIKNILDSKSPDHIQNQYAPSKTSPLGKDKLRAVELLQSIVSLKRNEIFDALGDSDVMQTILQLISRHPWNNMIQLKAHLIFEDVLGSDMGDQ